MKAKSLKKAESPIIDVWQGFKYTCDKVTPIVVWITKIMVLYLDYYPR